MHTLYTNIRVAYVVNNASFFVSHRLPIAAAALDYGFEVRLFTGLPGSLSMEVIASEKLKAISIPHDVVSFTSSGVNPFAELKGLIQLVFLLKQYQPTIIHCASPKGVLYGGIAAKICKTKCVILAITGMGYAFTDSKKFNPSKRLVRWLYQKLQRIAFDHCNITVIVQNNDDREYVIQNNLANHDQVRLIPGSGVSLCDFENCNPHDKDKIVLLPARLVKDKGLQEFVAAAEIIKKKHPEWRFILAGASDYNNPGAFTESEIKSWQQRGFIDWVGHVDDMRNLFAKSSIVCLPSYREGMPKALLEAAAAGCAVVTTNVTGCREAIINGVTGDLVPVNDVESLANALLRLINDDSRRINYGINGRIFACKHFSINSVINQTIEIYRGMLKNE